MTPRPKERVASCSFCGQIGHRINGCPTMNRLGQRCSGKDLELFKSLLLISRVQKCRGSIGVLPVTYDHPLLKNIGHTSNVDGQVCCVVPVLNMSLMGKHYVWVHSSHVEKIICSSSKEVLIHRPLLHKLTGDE